MTDAWIDPYLSRSLAPANDTTANIPSPLTSILDQMLRAAAMGPYTPDTTSYPSIGPNYPTPQRGMDPSPTVVPSRDQLLGVGPRDPTGQAIENDRVYMGHDELVQDFVHTGSPDEQVKRKTMTVQAALNLPYSWSEDKISDVMKKMREAGLSVGSGDSFGDMLGVWQTLVTRASRTYTLSGGETAVTPFDILSTMKKENIEAGVLDKDGNLTQTSVSKSVNDLTEGQAWSIMRQTMQEMLGRDPSDQEVRDFLSAANNDAAQDPSRTRTTTTTNTETGESTSSTTNHGGYTADDAAKSAYDELHDDADYAAYQSAGTLFNWIVGALGEVAGSA